MDSSDATILWIFFAAAVILASQASPALPVKRPKLSYDDLARLHGQIVAIQMQLAQTTNPEERNILQQKLDRLIDIYTNSPSV